jgi:hypothetical protein
MNETKIQPIFIDNYFNDSPISHFRPFSNKKVAAYILENVYLHTASGVVFDKNFKIIKETADDYSFWMPRCIHAFPQNQRKAEIYKRIKDLQKIIYSNKNKKEIIKIQKQCIHLLTPRNTYSFGHIFDYLQKNEAFQTMKNQEDFLYLISDNSLIKDFHIYLQAFDINPNKCIIPNNLGKFLFFKKMIFPFSPENYESMSEECYIKYIDKIKEKTLIHIDEYKNLKEVNLYLSRSKNTRLGRKVIDEEILLQYLKDKNFIILNGDESLYEIIFLFSKAKFIFGLHGSLFLNAIYCNKNCKILELNSRIYTKYAYKNNTRFFLKKENYEVINIKKDDKLNVKSQDIIDILKNYI